MVGSTSVNVTDAIIDSDTMCVKLISLQVTYDKYVIISYNEFGPTKKTMQNYCPCPRRGETPVIDFGSDGLNFTVSENAASSYISEPLMKYTSDEDHFVIHILLPTLIARMLHITERMEDRRSCAK